MNKDIREQLEQMAEIKYRDFSAALIPDSKPLLGVRLPMLRNMAKDMVKSKDWKEELKYPDVYFEEVMLRGMCIGYGTSKEKNIKEAFTYLDDFVNVVDNWSVCDSCCASFDIFDSYREETWEYIQKFLYSDKEFYMRVGLILLLDHFLKYDDEGKKISRKRSVEECDLHSYLSRDLISSKVHKTCDKIEIKQENHVDDTKNINRILNTLNRPFTQGYYAQMAAAWLTAECFVTFPEKTWKFLNENQMDTFTYNKALQKICESRTPDEDVKNKIRRLKRR